MIVTKKFTNQMQMLSAQEKLLLLTKLAKQLRCKVKNCKIDNDKNTFSYEVEGRELDVETFRNGL